MEAPEVAQIFALLLSASRGAIILKVIEHLPALFNGRAKSRGDDVDRALAERDKAQAEAATSKQERAHSERARDSERKIRRIVEEHAARLRRVLIEATCVDSATIPPCPTSSPETGPIDKEPA